MSTTKYRGQLGFTAPITVASQTLAYATGPTLNYSYETEELDLTAAGIVKAYANGKVDISISFEMKRFRTVTETTSNGETVITYGALPPDVQAILDAFKTGTEVAVSVTDSVIGSLSGPFIVDKCDENRANGKIIGYSVELKPTFTGDQKVIWTA